MVKQSELDELCKAFDEILWMAVRYAHGRHTYAPSMVRDACKVRAKFGKFELRPDHTLIERPPIKERWGMDLDSDYLFDLFETYRSD